MERWERGEQNVFFSFIFLLRERLQEWRADVEGLGSEWDWVHDVKFSKHQLKMFKKKETEKDPHHIMYRPCVYEIEVCGNCGKKTLIFCLIMNLRKQKTLKTKCQPLAEIPIVSIFPCFFMSLYA